MRENLLLAPDGDARSAFQGRLLYNILEKVVQNKGSQCFCSHNCPEIWQALGELAPNLDVLKTMTWNYQFSMCSEIVQITYLLWMKRVVFKKTQPRKIFIYVLMFAWKYIDIKWHFQRKMGEVVSISLPAIDCYLSSQSQRNDFRQFIIVSHRSWLSWTIVAQSLSRDCCHLVTMAESSRGFITSNSDTWARVAGTAGSAISLCLWPPDD